MSDTDRMARTIEQLEKVVERLKARVEKLERDAAWPHDPHVIVHRDGTFERAADPLGR